MDSLHLSETDRYTAACHAVRPSRAPGAGKARGGHVVAGGMHAQVHTCMRRLSRVSAKGHVLQWIYARPIQVHLDTWMPQASRGGGYILGTYVDIKDASVCKRDGWVSRLVAY